MCLVESGVDCALSIWDFQIAVFHVVGDFRLRLDVSVVRVEILFCGTKRGSRSIMLKRKQIVVIEVEASESLCILMRKESLQIRNV